MEKNMKMNIYIWGLGSSVVKNLPANAGDTGLIPVQEDPTCFGATKPVHHNY